MKDLNLTVQDIKDLMQCMSRNRIAAFKFTQENCSIELKGAREQAAAQAPPLPAVPDFREGPLPEDEPLDGYVVTSPIVGTFYAAPAPGQPPYVTVGSKVKKGDVLFIIESMKLMNEVTSERDGTVGKILVDNEQGVEFGQPILCLE